MYSLHCSYISIAERCVPGRVAEKERRDNSGDKRGENSGRKVLGKKWRGEGGEEEM